MSDRLKIYCRNIGEYVDVDGGEKLIDIYRGLKDRLGFEPVCAHVNNKSESLDYAVYHPKLVEFMPRNSGSGRRCYTRSLCMVLYLALTRLYPQARLKIEHSISQGYYCLLGGLDAEPQVIDALRAEMRRIVEEDMHFELRERLTRDVIELFRSQGLDDKVLLLETERSLYTSYYRLGEICDSYYGTLAYSTGQLDVFDLRPYKEGMLLLGFDPADDSVPPQPLTQEKMYEAFTDYLHFNAILGVSNVGELNREVLAKRTSDLINVAEALHDKRIARISDEITARYREGGARLVLVAGPSSSGKTTTTKRLAIQLMTNLLKPQMISLDNYFINRDQTPLDADGEYDYESLYALDLEQFNSDLNRILAGEEVELPSYNFELGKRQYKGDKIRLQPNGILLIEGIHGLNPELTAHIAEDMKFRVYVSALTTLSVDDHNWVPTTDNRLLRRIIRDYKYRGASAEETIRRWPSVRRGEERWIFPYQENADATFNSSLLFELGVMKEYGEEILKSVPCDVPEYGEAYRLRKFLSHFLPIGDRMIPPTSLLREFLGGSSFKY
ncbi:MAG: nucleoside kinase [Muribaculaceae bacterium]|nr:nucleoside kinase [Muribaculaceae bacterium]